MSTIALRVNEKRLVENLRDAFSSSSMLGELLQNARRAAATKVEVTTEEGHKILNVMDDGCGIGDLQKVLSVAESGWDAKTVAGENAFGMGLMGVLYHCQDLTVKSTGGWFAAATASILAGKPVQVQPYAGIGTRVTLMGVAVPHGRPIREWAAETLAKLVRGYPLPVFFEGAEVPREDARAKLELTSIEHGFTTVNLAEGPGIKAMYLQGLPIESRHTHWTRGQVVHLDDKVRARMPDRQTLVEPELFMEVAKEVDAAGRDRLRQLKAALSGREFFEKYADACFQWRVPELLNDVPFAHMRWFVDMASTPTGFWVQWADEQCCWPSEVVERETIEQKPVVVLCHEEAEDREDFLSESWVRRSDCRVLSDATGLHPDHWLMQAARRLAVDDFELELGQQVSCGEIELTRYAGPVYLYDHLFVKDLVGGSRVEVGEAMGCVESGPEPRWGGESILLGREPDVSAAVREAMDYRTEDEGFADDDAETDSRALWNLYVALRPGTSSERLCGVLAPALNSRIGTLAGKRFVIAFNAEGKFIPAATVEA